MADILIKGMEMPKRGIVVNIYANGRVTDHFDEFQETIGTAVPVPPHGRLIDADAVSDRMKELMHPSDMANNQWFINTLREMPTIIPADKED